MFVNKKIINSDFPLILKAREKKLTLVNIVLTIYSMLIFLFY